MITANSFVKEHRPLPPYSVLEEIFSAGATHYEPSFSLRQTMKIERHTFPVEVPEWIRQGTLAAMTAALEQGATKFPGEINDMGHLHIVLYEKDFPNMTAIYNRPYYPPSEIYDPEKCAGLLFHTQEYINGEVFGIPPSRCNVFYSTSKREAFVFSDPRNTDSGERFATRSHDFNALAETHPDFVSQLGIAETPVTEPDHGLYFYFGSNDRREPELIFKRHSSPTQEQWSKLYWDSVLMIPQDL